VDTKQIEQAIFELEYYMQVAKASNLEAPGMVFALKTMRALKIVGSFFEPNEEADALVGNLVNKAKGKTLTPLRSVKDEE
jgi:hypothetical protein